MATFETFAQQAARRAGRPSFRLSPTQQASLISSIGSKTIGGIAAAGNVLDLPGSTIRDLSTWVPGGIRARNPFDQWLTPTSPVNRTTGRELLRSAGLAQRRNTARNLAGGVGLEIAMDPLTYLTLGGSAITQAGRVAKNAGLLRNLKQVAHAKTGAAYGTLGGAQMRAGTTLDDLIRAGGPQAAERAQRAAQSLGMDVAQLRGERVGGLVGVGVPFRDPSMVLGGAGPGGAAAAAVGRALGHGRLSPVPLLRGLFDYRVREHKIAAFQQAGEQVTTLTEADRVANKGRMLRQVDDWQRVAADPNDHNTTSRYLEGIQRPVNPNEKAVIDDVRSSYVTNIQNKKTTGARAVELEGEYISDYATRGASTPQRSVLGRGRSINTSDPRNLRRAEELNNWEGGTGSVREIISDPMVVAMKKAGAPDGEIRKYIDEMYGQRAWSLRDDIDAKVLPENPEWRTHLGRYGERMYVPMRDANDVEDFIRGNAPDEFQMHYDARDAVDASRGGENTATVLVDPHYQGWIDTSNPNWQRNYLDQQRATFNVENPGASRIRRSVAGFAVPAGTKFSRGVERRIAKLVKDQGWTDTVANGFRQIVRNEDLPNSLPKGVQSRAAKINGLTQLIQRLPVEAVEQGLFGNQPFYDAMQAADSASLVVNSANAATDTVASLLRNPKELARVAKRSTEEPVLLSQALKSAGLMVGSEKSPGRAMTVLAQKIGGNTRAKDLFDVQVPGNVARELARPLEMFRGPVPVGEVVQGYDSLLNLVKGYLTGVFPAFHTRNLVSGQFRNWIDQAAGGQADAAKVLRGETIQGLEKVPEIQQRLRQRGLPVNASNASKEVRMMAAENSIIGRHEGLAGEMVGMSGEEAIRNTSTTQGILSELPGSTPYRPIGGAVEALRTGSYNPLEVRGVGGREQSAFKLGRVGEHVGYGVEGINRIAPFLQKIRQGIDSAEAARQLKAAQVDYLSRRYTRFENEIMRRAFPFYKFTRANAPYVAQELMQRPGGRLAQTIRTISSARESDAMTPDYVAETTSMPIGGAPAGVDRYLTGLGLMFEEPFAFFSGDRTIKNALLEAGSRLSPMVKAPLEWMTGQSFFQKGPQGGRSLDDLDPTIGRTLSNIGQLVSGGYDPTQRVDPVQLPQALEFLTMNSPLSRFVSSARVATDPRKNISLKALNLLTGARITDVSPGARDAILREKISDFMKLYGGRQFVRDYLPKERLEALPPRQRAEAMQLKAMMDELDRAAKARARQR